MIYISGVGRLGELLDMSGDFVGTCLGVSHPLVVVGDLCCALRCAGCALRARHPVCALQSDHFVTSFCR